MSRDTRGKTKTSEKHGSLVTLCAAGDDAANFSAASKQTSHALEARHRMPPRRIEGSILREERAAWPVAQRATRPALQPPLPPPGRHLVCIRRRFEAPFNAECVHPSFACFRHCFYLSRVGRAPVHPMNVIFSRFVSLLILPFFNLKRPVPTRQAAGS